MVDYNGAFAKWVWSATPPRSLDKPMVLGRPFVKQFALCYRPVVCLSVISSLSVTLVYCGQTVEWIKTKLGVEVGLGPGHMVLDRDSALPPLKGHSPQF